MSMKRYYAVFVCVTPQVVEGNVMFCGQPPVEVGLAVGQAEIDEYGEGTIKVAAPCPACGEGMQPIGVASVH